MPEGARPRAPDPGAVRRRTIQPSPTRGSSRMTAKARWCARSGSSADEDQAGRGGGTCASLQARRQARHRGRSWAQSCSAARGVADRVLDAQQRDRRLEVVERVEALVDAREAQVGDLVELAQRRQDREADVVRLDLGRAGRADGLLDPLREQRRGRLSRHRTALAGLAHAGDDLLAAERLDHAVALDHAEARGLGRAEAAAAFGALAAPADREAVVADCGSRRPGCRGGGRTGRTWCHQATGREPDGGRDSRAQSGKRASTASPWAGSRSASAERHDVGAHRARARAVVADDLLRSQERVGTEPGREPRLSPGRQHVVRAGEVVAEAHRRVRRRGRSRRRSRCGRAPARGLACLISRCSGP